MKLADAGTIGGLVGIFGYSLFFKNSKHGLRNLEIILALLYSFVK